MAASRRWARASVCATRAGRWTSGGRGRRGLPAGGDHIVHLAAGLGQLAVGEDPLLADLHPADSSCQPVGQVMMSDIGAHLLERAVSQEGKAPGGGDGDRRVTWASYDVPAEDNPRVSPYGGSGRLLALLTAQGDLEGLTRECGAQSDLAITCDERDRGLPPIDLPGDRVP